MTRRRAPGTGAEAIQVDDDERPRRSDRPQSPRPSLPGPPRRISARWATRRSLSSATARRCSWPPCSRFFVGWAVSAVNDRRFTIKALEMAQQRRCPEIGLLHHSDRSCTYTSEDYQAALTARGIVCSMSRRGDCYDNAVMEASSRRLRANSRTAFEATRAQRWRCSITSKRLIPTPSPFDARPDQSGRVRTARDRRGRGRHGKPPSTRFPTAPTPVAFLSERRATNSSNDVVNLSTGSDQAPKADLAGPHKIRFELCVDHTIVR